MDVYDGFTFDDVLLVPKVSRLSSRKDVNTSSVLMDNITVSIPLVSSNMDTVTGSRMAILIARLGGVGLIHRFLSIEDEVDEITRVKREENIIIEKPYTIPLSSTLNDLKALIEKYGVSSFPVMDGEKLVGIITKRDFQFESDSSARVKDLMTKDVITAPKGTTAEEAKRLLKKNKLEKLPLVDEKGKLVGLIAAKDINKASSYVDASKDKKGRLLVGASIGISGDYEKRAKAVFEAEADFVVVDVANGYLQKTADVVRQIKKTYGVSVMAGDVATAEGVQHLKSAGADSIKVGIGPGSACLTRPVAGVGYPQLSALIECANQGVSIICDGGISKSADFAKAIACGSDAVILGGMLAGTDESPGSIITKSGSNYKFYRGMASVNAYSDKAERLSEEVDIEGYTPEGTQMLTPYKGSAAKIITNMVGGLKSAMTYLNASNLKELRQNTRLVRLTEAGKKESKYLNPNI